VPEGLGEGCITVFKSISEAIRLPERVMLRTRDAERFH